MLTTWNRCSLSWQFQRNARAKMKKTKQNKNPKTTTTTTTTTKTLAYTRECAAGRKWSNPDSHTQKHAHKREERDVVRNKSLASLLRLRHRASWGEVKDRVRAQTERNTHTHTQTHRHTHTHTHTHRARERARERVCVKKCVRDPGKKTSSAWTGIPDCEHTSTGRRRDSDSTV